MRHTSLHLEKSNYETNIYAYALADNLKIYGSEVLPYHENNKAIF